MKILNLMILVLFLAGCHAFEEKLAQPPPFYTCDKSETVRQKAAECLIMQLKAPEAAKIEVDVNYSNSSIDDLRETTRALAQQQLQMIKSGAVTAEHVAHSDIIARKKIASVETDYEEISNENS